LSSLGFGVAAERADSQRNRLRVLAAAEEVFNEQGAAAITEEVARRAGVGIATVFRHFPTKQDLLEAVVLARLQRLVEAGRAILADGAPDGFFALFSLFMGEAAHKRVFGDVLTHAGESFKNANKAIVDELWASFASLIQRGQAAGLVRAGFDVADVRALLAGAHQALQVIGDDPDRQQRLFEVLRAGVRA